MSREHWADLGETTFVGGTWFLYAIYRVLAKGETLTPKYDLPAPEAITKDNIGSYDWKSWSWLG